MLPYSSNPLDAFKSAILGFCLTTLAETADLAEARRVVSAKSPEPAKTLFHTRIQCAI
jgi:hypothetical protein